ncbi:Glycoside hydrolase [Elusimicrobium minutum Pei191]|uniref:Glycoside hydrolase n=1 Tax=Elusimicrobium minutum (strain Pei191) TaxID=445932 RepID=B2KAP3_ELUMP|nr:DUF3536 domain-containing protein [Elusimicrobium minutum]ACC97589.1 Glycoside hydrolase [Elusimicrobium minutum Pei191]
MKYLCIHGHFYQPPRENAWTDAIDYQESAFPYHDWNDRICAECYQPNTKSRVLDGDKNLIALVNNYSSISFNFGPTLLSWMEEKQPDVYRAILEADRLSMKKFNGHGSALAQVYNHMIMPLANERDKRTQIIWGIEDFKKRFQRFPEGMWLAETACDTPTLELLAEQGIKFTILAPGQCAKTRKIGDKNWLETPNASVDPKKPYLCNLPSGKTITLFFYDGPISQGIAFSDTLKSGENFAAKLMGAFTDASKKDTELVHIATDGETYGHHQKFADMALAYCLKQVEDKSLAKITIYGEFLEKFPPKYEAKINENSSWSCFHGVERWRSNCGCNSGMHQGWNQKWRAPLRAALDLIRESFIKTFETKGSEFYHDVWDARNAYISFVLDRKPEMLESFFKAKGKERVWQDRQTAVDLMEMQHNAMLMYTSCGWFFDEISGIETVQIMQYAAKAIELHKNINGIDLEADFINKLSEAQSNIAELGNGGNIYERFVKTAAFTSQKAAVHYALTRTFNHEDIKEIYSYTVSDSQLKEIETGTTKAVTGKAVFTSKIDFRSSEEFFVLLYSQDYRIVCFCSEKPLITFEEIKNIIENNSTDEAIEQLQKNIPSSFTLSDLVKDAQRVVSSKILKKLHATTTEAFDTVFNSQYPLLRELKYIGTPIPKPFFYVAIFVLLEDLKEEISSGNTDPARIEEMLEDCRSLNTEINFAPVKDMAQKKLQKICLEFKENPDREHALAVIELLSILQSTPFAPDVFFGQEDVFTALKSLPKVTRDESAFKVLARKMKVRI